MSYSTSLTAAQTTLLVQNGDQRGQIVSLNKPKVIIGRELDCSLILADAQCSRHHAVILADEFSIRIRDLGSHNGTQVNGETIVKPTELNEGDQIRIGKTSLLVCRRVQGHHSPHQRSSEGLTTVAATGRTRILF